METRYKLGWLPDMPDTRDIPFAAVFRVPRKLPSRTALHSTMISSGSAVHRLSSVACRPFSSASVPDHGRAQSGRSPRR